jgi:hypothetical protein
MVRWLRNQDAEPVRHCKAKRIRHFPGIDHAMTHVFGSRSTSYANQRPRKRRQGMGVARMAARSSSTQGDKFVKLVDRHVSLKTDGCIPLTKAFLKP